MSNGPAPGRPSDAGHAPAALLGTSIADRLPVARWMHRLTDVAFFGESSDILPIRWVRGTLVPRLLPLVEDRGVPVPLLRLVAGYRPGTGPVP